ncbi:uncharacterized protein LOC130892899 [Diorhabda carinulata]|uniref:uncharacterized protein LOC130892899 n=1 Tax=Diorhabda carinulata TaxID=1163345 RepID=UPI0025A2BFA0|nr:uncharacterized protein LOC130892899 [Diorhabda carinulata]
MQRLNIPNLEKKLNGLKEQFLLGKSYTEEQINNFKRTFAYFKTQVKQRWLKSHKKEDIFIKYNRTWLEGTIQITVAGQSRPGRPLKSFGESSERTERRKTEEIRSTLDKEVIVHAAQTELRISGQRDASEILKQITCTTPKRATKYKKAFCDSKTKEVESLTVTKALAMFVDADLTRRQYESIRVTNKKFFPCYSLLQKAKQMCYPPSEEIRVTAKCVECNLQPLIDLTIKRLSMYLEGILISIKEEERDNLKIICKRDCDGSQQSQYKQKFENDSDSNSNVFHPQGTADL